ncbi:hypothetical protein [Hydrocarboniclastica marina]|uniref:Uncharacterized protein n=1 Tax=Hydrocarboniclastica marina TaxID=2259620 RepID=A0A4P7XI95_9ALTE|nr:hypothetical protein [Hydrocarboniclastica marina]QCF26718.1 hypothetical protein soil367_12680 [Hydrocarboniclastica marina]
MSSVQGEIQAFEEKMGLPKDFYMSLLSEGDWSFLIKLHALFEAAASHILTIRLGNGRLEGPFSYLELSNKNYGKATLLKELGAITGDQKKFIQALSELRNQLVHKIGNVAFSLDEHVERMNKDQLKSFASKFGHTFDDPMSIQGQSVSRVKFVKENPKLAIWVTASDVLACILVEETFAEVEKAKRELLERQAHMSTKIFESLSLFKSTVQTENEPNR